MRATTRVRSQCADSSYATCVGIPAITMAPLGSLRPRFAVDPSHSVGTVRHGTERGAAVRMTRMTSASSTFSPTRSRGSGAWNSTVSVESMSETFASSEVRTPSKSRSALPARSVPTRRTARRSSPRPRSRPSADALPFPTSRPPDPRTRRCRRPSSNHFVVSGSTASRRRSRAADDGPVDAVDDEVVVRRGLTGQRGQRGVALRAAHDRRPVSIRCARSSVRVSPSNASYWSATEPASAVVSFTLSSRAWLCSLLRDHEHDDERRDEREQHHRRDTRS